MSEQGSGNEKIGNPPFVGRDPHPDHAFEVFMGTQQYRTLIYYTSLHNNTGDCLANRIRSAFYAGYNHHRAQAG